MLLELRFGGFKSLSKRSLSRNAARSPSMPWQAIRGGYALHLTARSRLSGHLQLRIRP